MHGSDGKLHFVCEMGTLRVLLPYLGFALLHLQAASASSTPPLAKPGCLDKCGDIDVPYPFGLSPTCSHQTSYQLRCNESVDLPPKLMWGGLQVFNLNVEQGEMTVSFPISYRCYKGGYPMLNYSTNFQTNLIKDSPFAFSSKNKFTTIGCDTMGLLTGSSGAQSFTARCTTYCKGTSSKEANYSSSSCGVGCCQTCIRNGVRLATTNIFSENNKSSPSADELNCGYAFLVMDDNFTFQPDFDLKANQLLQSRPNMPVLVDWAIGGQDDPCKTSTDLEGARGSGCLAEHSECVSSAAEYGYRCKCSKGYHGNPYLENDGCQDIDECAHPDLHNCQSDDACVNTDGGYLCRCPHGQKGNGTKGGEACKPIIPAVVYRAVAACLSFMFLLLGVGRLVFRYNLMPKWLIKAIKPMWPKNAIITSIPEPDHSSSKGEDVQIRNAKKKKRYPVVEEEYLQAAKKCKKKLRILIAKNKCDPIMLCLAWLDVNAKTGKPFGTITHQLANDINGAVSLLTQLEEEPSNILSSADIRQLAGVVAVEVAGGPDVAFHPGREDNDEDMPRIDIGTKDSIVRYLGDVLIDSGVNLSVHDIVAISPWLRCNEDLSGFQFTWPGTFDNSYFKHLISEKEQGRLRCLPGHDQALLVDKEFLDVVNKYAEDEASFFADYAKSHMKLSELGFAGAD